MQGFGIKSTSPYRRKGTGFRRTSSFLETRIRQADETRGFAVTRLLTHWAEIVGADTAAHAKPVNVSYGRKGFGATLTVLTTAARAPMLQMQTEQIREKVNACYGYAAISRIRITQTAPTGFAEGQVAFAPAPAKDSAKQPDLAAQAEASGLAQGIENEELRQALAALGENILTSRRT